MKHLLYIIFWGLFSISTQQLVQKPEECFLRCIAKCLDLNENNLEEQLSISACTPKCERYRNNLLCNDDSCWNSCNNEISVGSLLASPSNLTLTGSRRFSWNSVPGASLYYIAFRKEVTKRFASDDYVITRNTHADLRDVLNEDPCAELEVIVAALSQESFGKESKELKVPIPRPTADPKLVLIGMQYNNTVLVSDFYQANATINVEFKYKTDSWILGDDDLTVQPLFHLISCVDPDLSQGIPVPIFTVHTNNKTISTSIGSDMMERKCRYVYYLQSVSSNRCGVVTEMPSPPSSAIQTIQIDCDMVKNAPCSKAPNYPHPQCGQVDNVQYMVLPQHDSYFKNGNLNLTVNISFSPVVRYSEVPTLYYVGVYGLANEYRTKEEETFLGVNISEVIGNVSSCNHFDIDGTCLSENSNRTLMIHGLHSKTLYGLTICAIKDIRNLTLPDLSETSKSVRPKAVKIFIEERTSSHQTALIVGIVVGSLAVLVCLASFIVYYMRRDKRLRLQEKLRSDNYQKKSDQRYRYTDFPTHKKDNDIWEIERRNLIIHSDEKLGSGAFGAVYLGKLIGKLLAHKDANSTLGINLLRAENCQVAVKMLPEYADELSKMEFLREISLMKTLGYHERLVNMLACITDTEPLCLVVEFCDSGDLLQFLRERCKYMMKLDDLNINYHDPPCNDSYDPKLVITLKQLLQFSVQISYGLEYLSQKGYLHRDIAARNILVHGGKECKIGDFGLCRYIYGDESLYRSKGGKLPLKWMSPESIRDYEFTIKSDVWSFGILLFEIITLGGSPYPGMPPDDVLPFLESGGRISRPDNCPENFYEVMKKCWMPEPQNRIEFSEIRQQLAVQLEEIADDYNYLKLDAAKDYYNVQYKNKKMTAAVSSLSDISI